MESPLLTNALKRIVNPLNFKIALGLLLGVLLNLLPTSVYSQCTGTITGSSSSMTLAINAGPAASGSVSVQLGSYLVPAVGSIVQTLGINQSPLCAGTPKVYVNNGGALGALVASGSGGLITFNCSDVGATKSYFFLYDLNGNPNDDNRFPFTINVIDNLPPAITCPSNKTFAAPASPGNPCQFATTAASGLSPTVSDNCTTTASIAYSYSSTGMTTLSGSGSANGQTFNAGVSTVVYTSSDQYGNTSTCSFTVTVTEGGPSTAPTITCPTSVTVYTDAGGCYKTISNSSVANLTPTYTDVCPASLVLTYALSGATAGVGTGNAYGTFNRINGATAGSTNEITTITYTVKDASGNTTTCSMNVTVKDNIPPVLTCPGNITANVNPGVGICFATYGINTNLPTGSLTPVINDNCATTTQLNNRLSTLISGVSTGSYGPGSPVPFGFNFNIGVSTVVYTVYDRAIPTSNSSTCSFTVTVLDNAAPTVSTTNVCGTTQNPVALAGACNAVLSGTTDPVFSDCSTPLSLSYNVTGASNFTGYNSVNGATFNVGTSVVTYISTDTYGNTGTCSFSVVVYEGTPTLPTITTPCFGTNGVVGNVDYVYAGNGCYYTTSNTQWVPVYTDNCNSAIRMEFRIYQGTPATPSLYYPGTGNALVSAPAIAAPWIPYNSTTQNVLGINLPINTFTSNYIVEWRIIDDGMPGPGNVIDGSLPNPGTEACLRWFVNVSDNTPPSLTCPTNKVTFISAGNECVMPVIGIKPTVTDNCDYTLFPGDDWTINVQVSGAGVLAPYGASRWGSVTPSAALPAVPSSTLGVGVIGVSSGTDYNFHDVTTSQLYSSYSPAGGILGLYAAQNYGDGADGWLFRRGVTTVKYRVADVSGNSSECSFTVSVLDPDPPVITCPGDFTINTSGPACSAVINPTPTVTDKGVCDTNVGLKIKYEITGATTMTSTVDANYVSAYSSGGSFYSVYTNLAPAFTLNVGVNYVKCIAFDISNNSDTCTFVVTVKDATAPTVTCPTSKTYSAAAASCTATLTTAQIAAIALTASDNCGGTPTVTYTLTGATTGSASGTPAVFNGGTTVVTYSATDGTNTATCSFSVTVNDVTAPTVTCPSNVTISANSGCNATTTPTAPTVNDACGVTSYTYSVNGGVFNPGLPSNIALSAGTSTIRYVAYDAASNSASCSFTITVVDNTPPVISYTGADITLNANPFTCEANYSWYEPSLTGNASCPGASDACNNTGLAIARSYVSGPNPNILNGLIPFNQNSCQYQNSSFQVGVTVIRYTFTDGNGVSAYRDVKVTVVPGGTGPAPSCKGATVYVTPTTATVAVVDVENPPVTGGNPCSTASILTKTVSPSSFTCAQVGTTQTVTLTYTYNFGSPQSCNASVQVRDIIAPTLTGVPTNMTVACGTTLPTPPSVTATDNCSGSVTPVYNQTGSTSGCTTIYTRTWTATDASGNVATGTQTISLTDNVAPSFGAAPTTASATGCNAVVSLNLSTFITDNCGTITVTNSRTGSGADASGAYPSGTTVVLFTATDACGNSSTHNVTVTVSGSVNAITSNAVNPTDCSTSNGQLSASASGGNGTYTYLWSNGATSQTITGLAAGTYTVTVTSAGCTAIAAGTLTCTNPPCGLVVNTSSTPSSGSNGTATAVGSGTSGTYSYLWSTGGTTSTISGLAAGTYAVTVTSSVASTCSLVTTVTVPSLGSTIAFTVVGQSGTAGNTINIPITVNNFTNVSAFSMTFKIADTTVAKFVGTNGYGIGDLNSSNFALLNGGTLTSVYFTSGAAVNLSNGTTLVNLAVNLVGAQGTGTTLTIMGTPTPLEAVVNSVSVVPATNGGSISISGITGGGLTIAGTFVNENGAAIDSVQVAMSGGTTGNKNTGATNAYNFNVASGVNVTITPQKLINQGNGISIADLVDIQRHILGSNLLPTAYKRIAADANCDDKITTLDLVALRSLLLNGTTLPGGCPSWKFVPSGTAIPMTASFVALPYSTISSLTNVTTNQSNVNFIGIKVGDVNISADPTKINGNGEERGSNLELNIANEKLSLGSIIEVSVYINDKDRVTGLQGTFKFNTDYLNYVAINTNFEGMDRNNFYDGNALDGKVSMVWFDHAGQNFNPAQPVATLKFRVMRSAELKDVLEFNSSLTPAIASNDLNQEKGVQLTFANVNHVANFELMQNQPNPYTNKTTIGFVLPTSGDATLIISDISGKIVKKIENSFAKGYNEVTLQRSELPTAGVYYYTLKAGEHVSQKKMIIIE